MTAATDDYLQKAAAHIIHTIICDTYHSLIHTPDESTFGSGIVVRNFSGVCRVQHHE